MDSLIHPPSLVAGDHIALISPSRYTDSTMIEQAKQWAESHGFVGVKAGNLGEQSNQFGCSSSQRAADVNTAIGQPLIKAIWAIRGGYGAVNMVDLVDWEALKASPKWLIGFSDFTHLIGKAHVNGLAALHAWMPIQLPQLDTSSKNSLALALQGKALGLCAKPHDLNRHGQSTGLLIGGNLSVLYSMIGSDSFPCLDGAILFLEDLDEHFYHIDRMMWALKRSGSFKGLQGMIAGDMTDMHDNDVPFGMNALEILAEHCPKSLPFAAGFPFGHEKRNETLVTGSQVTLTVDSQGAAFTYLP